jgi:putative flippase GtrA
MLLQHVLWRFNYLWCSRWFSTFKSICNFSTVSIAKKNNISVCSICSNFEHISLIIILVIIVVHQHIHLDNLIGIPVVFIINFIQQVPVRDIEHRLSVRKKIYSFSYIFQLLKSSSHWYR